jgi:LysR family glycine cleavage system transcriptional activator
VCSPQLLEGLHPLLTPADLKHHTLIHEEFQIDWAMWLRTVGIEGVDPHRGPRFYSSEHAVQAAVLGQGVVLGRSALVADDLATGRLVRPFAFSLPAGWRITRSIPTRSSASGKAFERPAPNTCGNRGRAPQ